MSPRDIGLALFVQALWGLNFVAVKVGLAYFPPLLLMALRMALVALVLAPFITRPRGTAAWRLFWVSVTLGSVHFPLMLIGLNGVDAATAVITVQVQVPFAALLAALLWRERLSWGRALGMAVSFAGIIVIAGEPRLEGSFGHFLMLLGAAFAFAVSTLQIKGIGPSVNAFAFNGWLAVWVLPQMLLLSWWLEEGQITALTAADARGWSAIAFMALVVSIGAHGLWYWLVRRYDVNQTVPFILTLPVFGVASSVVFLGEPVTARLLWGGTLVMAGMAAAVIPNRRSPTSPLPAP